MNKKVSLGAAICFMGIVAAITFVITMLFSMDMINGKMANVKERERIWNKLSEVDGLVRQNYVNDIDEDILLDSISTGYVRGLNDKYGTYLTAEQVKKDKQDSEGVLVGIGITATQDESGYIKINKVYPNSPASEAGLQKGDLIVKVADKDVLEIGYNKAITMVAGEAGTKVKITYRSDGEDKEQEFTRKKVEIPSVSYHMIGKNGYIKIEDFNSATVKQFELALKFCTTKGAKGLIFDLRNNPGGTLDSVDKMLDTLLPAGAVGYQRTKDGKKVSLYTSDAKEVKLPMVTLTNKNTASAAELFVSALKDYNKAKSVGGTTFGKGIMQTLFNLKDGSAIRITTAYFDPPKSANFHGVGIKADFPVTLTQQEEKDFELLDETSDPQLKKAIEVVSAAE